MTYHIGDCLDVMRTMPDDSVDLIVTSPPYAERRKDQYGGIPAKDYSAWFLPRAEEMMRLLKPTGSFILNIKEHCEDGQRSDYVMRLVLALRDQGWLLIDEYCWHKKNTMPARWKNRFRDAWERVYHFTQQLDIKMRRDEVKVKAMPSSMERGKHLSEKDRRIRVSETGSGFNINMATALGKEWVYPSNVLHMATESGNKNHPAAFPDALPLFFIKLFTDPGDTVLDPFAGSGTTCIVAQRMNRVPIGIELNADYVRPLGQDPML